MRCNRCMETSPGDRWPVSYELAETRVGLNILQRGTIDEAVTSLKNRPGRHVCLHPDHRQLGMRWRQPSSDHHNHPRWRRSSDWRSWLSGCSWWRSRARVIDSVVWNEMKSAVFLSGRRLFLCAAGCSAGCRWQPCHHEQPRPFRFRYATY